MELIEIKLFCRTCHDPQAVECAVVTTQCMACDRQTVQVFPLAALAATDAGRTILERVRIWADNPFECWSLPCPTCRQETRQWFVLNPLGLPVTAAIQTTLQAARHRSRVRPRRAPEKRRAPEPAKALPDLFEA